MGFDGETKRRSFVLTKKQFFVPNKQSEKILDLSPVQLTVSNSSQTSVDSVSLFVSDLSQVLKPGLSQAVSMLDSVIGVRSGVGTVHVS